MMEAAAEAAGADLMLLGVTVLTSMTASDVGGLVGAGGRFARG